MSCPFFADTPPVAFCEWVEWVESDYEIAAALAPELLGFGILVEPDSREPWFMCEAHHMKYPDETLAKFEAAMDIKTRKLSAARRPSRSG